MDVSLLLQSLTATPAPTEKEELKKKLSDYINSLLLTDFEQLVNLLYRVDVPEAQLKKVLQENREADAGDLIADLLIKRQEEKIALRRSFPPADHATDEERW